MYSEHNQRRHVLKCILFALGVAVVLFGLMSSLPLPSASAANGPDLVVVNTTFLRLPSGNYKLEGRVRNVGNQNAGANKLLLRISFPNNQKIEELFDVAALGAGAEEATIHSIQGTIVGKQATEATATADFTNVVVETIETNNTVNPPLINCFGAGGAQIGEAGGCPASVGGIAIEGEPALSQSRNFPGSDLGTYTGVAAGTVGVLLFLGLLWGARVLLRKA